MKELAEHWGLRVAAIAPLAVACSSGEVGDADAGVADASPAPDAAAIPGEVRGVRIVPGEDEVTVRFQDAPNADTYTLCWGPEADPLAGACAEDVRSPHTQTGLTPGERLFFAVLPRNEVGTGPVVEIPSAVPGAARRPLAIHIEMRPHDLEHLYARSPTSNTRLPAEVFLGDATGPAVAIPDVRGIRFRGASSRRQPRKAFNIRLDSRPQVAEFPGFNFRGLGRRGGDRVLLNQTWTDPTGIRPALSLAMYDELGLPAPTTFFADLWLSGIYEGFYVGVERVDREALRRWGLNRSRGEFTLVRDRARQQRWRDEIAHTSMFSIDPDTLGDTDSERIELLQAIFDYRGETDDHDWEELLDLLRWVRATEAGPAFAEGLERRFDTDSLIDLLALYLMQDDFDSFADDYWLYRDDTGDGLWRVIPWDQERTFGNRFWIGTSAGRDTYTFYGNIVAHFRNPLFERTLDTFEGRIDARIRELYAEVFTEAWFDAKIDRLVAEVEASLVRWPKPAFERHPRQHDGAPGYLARHIDTLRDFVALRRIWLTADGGGERLAYRGKVLFDERGVAHVADGDGVALLRLDGAPGERLDLDVELVDVPGDDGLRVAWRIENRGDPWRGRVTLYFRNRPGQTWLPRLDESGRAWELTVVADGDRWLPTRVNPFSNAVAAELELAGERELEVRFRR